MIDLKLKSIIYELNIKFLISTILIFFSIYNVSLNELQILESFNISLGNILSFEPIKAILYSFMFFEHNYNIVTYIGLLCIYLLVIYFILNNIFQDIQSLSFYKILRLKSYSKYFIKIFIKICIISFTYFFVGIITMLIASYLNFGFTNIDINSIKFVLKIFLLFNLITISYTFFIVILSILLNNTKLSLIFTISIFSISLFHEIKFLPGYYCVLNNSMNQLEFLKDPLLNSFVFLVVTISILIYIIRKNIDLFLKFEVSN